MSRTAKLAGGAVLACLLLALLVRACHPPVDNAKATRRVMAACEKWFGPQGQARVDDCVVEVESGRLDRRRARLQRH